MEQRSWSLMEIANGIEKKRHISLDSEETNKSNKRVCVEPFRDPMGFDSSLDLDNIWEAEPSTIHPYFQYKDIASELFDSEETNKSNKRVCVESFCDPMGFDSSLDLNNIWEAESSTIHPYFQYKDTASELFDSSEAQLGSSFTVTVYDRETPYFKLYRT